MFDFSSIYAKSDNYTTLEMHTNDVLIAAENLIESLPLTDKEKEYYLPKLKRMAVLHDLGKIHAFFQQNLLDSKKLTIRHELVSFWFCENYLNMSVDEIFAIATHHKGIIKNDDKGRLDSGKHFSPFEKLCKMEEQKLQSSTLKDWLTKFEIKIPFKEKQNNNFKISIKWKKIFHFYKQSEEIKDKNLRTELSMCRALLMAADHIGSAKMEDKIPKPKPIAVQDFQPTDGKQHFELRDFQKKMLNVIYSCILHSPTDSGKTEAALAWVYANQSSNSRLFYLLPYTASSNAMVNRLKTVFGDNKVTPLHSKTLDYFYDELDDEDEIYKKHRIAKSKSSLSREIFFPVKVATMHQLLKNTLKGKGWEFALLEYKNALFIIDEFHTYNAFYTGLLLASVKLLIRYFNAKVMFMSATIPAFMQDLILKHVFDNSESVTFKPDKNSISDKQILERKRHQPICIDSSLNDKFELIEHYLPNHSVLIIVNNVKTAQDIFESELLNGIDNKCLLHGGLHAKDRKIIEEKITSKDKTTRPRVLVATQAVEVSLDIDYDVAFIENAPIDALIQRFGRVNRAGQKYIKAKKHSSDSRYNTVPVYLFKNIIGKTPFYDKEVLESTWNEFEKLNGKQVSEDDLIEVCNQVYKNGYSKEQQEDFEHGFHNATINNFETDWVAGDWNRWTDEMFDKNQKVDMLCSNLMDEYDQLIEQKNYIEANRLIVQVYPHYLVNNAPFDKVRNLWLGYEYDYIPMIGYKKKEDDLFL